MVTMITVGVCGLGLMDSILVNAVSAGEWVLWGWVGLNGYNDYSGCMTLDHWTASWSTWCLLVSWCCGVCAGLREEV